VIVQTRGIVGTPSWGRGRIARDPVSLEVVLLAGTQGSSRAFHIRRRVRFEQLLAHERAGGLLLRGKVCETLFAGGGIAFLALALLSFFFSVLTFEAMAVFVAVTCA